MDCLRDHLLKKVHFELGANSILPWDNKSEQRTLEEMGSDLDKQLEQGSQPDDEHSDAFSLNKSVASLDPRDQGGANSVEIKVED
mmetsp:Transcript_11369/g.17169  ORF Transcript_11369/g.17169 Transcript_11369/m.17169 type:complete len:85 (+) Transcript_11369:1695-1949(+)